MERFDLLHAPERLTKKDLDSIKETLQAEGIAFEEDQEHLIIPVMRDGKKVKGFFPKRKTIPHSNGERIPLMEEIKQYVTKHNTEKD